MTTPVFTEAWASQQTAEAIVTPPGGTLPVAGPETWTMAGGFAGFPAADPALIPPSLFRVFDPAAPAEAILVRQAAPASPTWQVTRADQGTTPLAHAPGFTVRSLLSPAGLAAIAAGVPSGNGLVLPAAAQGGMSTWTSAAETRVAELSVPGGEAVPGSVYEATAWGYYTTAGPAANIICGVRWGGVQLGDPAAAGHAFPVAGTSTADVARWKMHGVVSVTGTAAAPVGYASLAVWLSPHNAVDRPQAGTELRGYLTGVDAATVIVTATPQPFYLPIAQSIAGGQMWSLGSTAGRSA
jgi:hypothetical protein